MTVAVDVWVSEIREYPRINAEVVRLLDLGAPLVRLRATEGQRLLLARLRGDWSAVIEIEGNAGPELAAELEAPQLKVVCRGPAMDGAGRGLKSGELYILGNAGEAVGMVQSGGLILVAGSAGARAGLRQRGGSIVLLGPTGRLTGERQSGGSLFAIKGKLGPFAGHARTGGRLAILEESEEAGSFGGIMDVEDRGEFSAIIRQLRQFEANDPGVV